MVLASLDVVEDAHEATFLRRRRSSRSPSDPEPDRIRDDPVRLLRGADAGRPHRRLPVRCPPACSRLQPEAQGPCSRCMRPLRFGVVAESARTPDDLLCTARLAEDAGCSTLLIRDHFIEGPFEHQLAPLTALTFVAAATSRLRIGTLVIDNDYRHPVVLAKELATLDLLSGGRVEPGLGAGFLRREYEQAGLAFDPPGIRVSRLAESLPVLKGLLAGEPVTFHGAHYDIDGLTSFPPSIQRPHPPILVAAAQPRMLAIAAREADIVSFQSVSTGGGVVADPPAGRSPDALARQVALVREAAGARFDQLELSTTANVVVTDRPREAAEQQIRQRGWNGISADEVLAMPTMFLGSRDHMAGLFAERRERFGISYWILFDGALPGVAPHLSSLLSAAR
jgi:probable F420-dependent oxidoreductase